MNDESPSKQNNNGRLSSSLTVVSDATKKSGSALTKVSNQAVELANTKATGELARLEDGEGEWSTSLQTVLETPPSSLPQRLILGGLAFISVFGLWAYFGQVEQVGKATGRLIPRGEVVKLQSVEVGTVIGVAVDEGDEVREGQLIIKLDPSNAQAEVDRLEESITSLESRLAQHKGLISETNQENISRLAIANAAVSSQQATIMQNQREMTSKRELLHLMEGEIAIHEERLQILRPSLEEGVISREYLFNAEQAYRDQVVAKMQASSDLKRIEAEAIRLSSELQLKQSEVQRTQSEIQQNMREMETTTLQLEGEIAQDKNRLESARANLDRLSIYAPIDGTISALNIQHVGEVTERGQTVVEIAPKGAPLVLRASLPSREAGFAKVGMPAQIKLEAFPYQDFGILEGTLSSISPDVKPNEQLGPSYDIEVLFNSSDFTSQKEGIELKTGQTADVEIVIRKQRIIDLLLDPFQQINQDGLSL